MPDSKLILLLKKYGSAFSQVVPVNLNSGQVTRLDFTAKNPLIAVADLQNTEIFAGLVQEMLAKQKATVGVGGYLENRDIYRRSGHFSNGSENRSIHLGVDIWMPAFTPVLAPLSGTVHSFKYNANFGDYGPTIILEHELEGTLFYTLYGHLTHTSLLMLTPGQEIKKGEEFTQIGPYPENGDWPPHLHFQLIADMHGFSGDFPGVCAPSELEKYTSLCPDPNLILQSRFL